jgi:hypothetical protein
MRGVKVITRSGKRTISMCGECYKKEMDDIELIIEHGIICKPIVSNIDKCEIHCQEKKNEST